MAEIRQQEVDILDRQLMVRHDSTVYTYRTHEKAADRYSTYETCRKWVSIVLMVLATGSFLVTLTEFLWQSPKIGGLIISGVAMLAAGVAFIADYWRYEEKISNHRSTAIELRQVAIGFEALRVDLWLGSKSIEQICNDRDELLAREKEVLSVAPRTTSADYEKANKALKGDEKIYSPEAEIATRDLFAKKKG